MKIFDYIFLFRPMLIIPVWTISLLGARAAEWRTRGLNPFAIDRYPMTPFSADDQRYLLLLLLETLLAGGVFILNQIHDVESDRHNKKLFLIAEGHVSVGEAWMLYLLSTSIAVVGAFLLNWQLGILFFIGGLVGLQYSLPHFNLREHPYKSFRNNVIGHGILAFLFGWVMTQNFNIEGLVKSIPYFLAVGAVYLNTTLPDLVGDKTAGKKTYGIEWGVNKTVRASLLLTLAALGFSIMTADYAFAIAAGISLPFFIAANSRKSIQLATLASKVSVLALSVAAAIYFPIYAVLVIVTILATKVYYSKKFSMSYPTLMEKGK